MRRDWLAAALLGLTLPLAAPALAQLSIGVSIRLAPPPLPVYAQPALPGPDYLWTPGYWAWDDDVQAYFWVPGTWVRAPRPGLLWTPPWWGWNDGLYLFHSGYWGPHIGFYGGVPYGFGYTGFGYQGGYWNGGHVFYNRTVNNITNVHVTNVYERNVTVNRVTRTSYNGGPGGVQARPSVQEQLAVSEAHVAPTGNQRAHFAAAHADPRAFASANHGRPPVAATPRPLNGPGPSRQPQPAAAGPGAPHGTVLQGFSQQANRTNVRGDGPASAASHSPLAQDVRVNRPPRRPDDGARPDAVDREAPRAVANHPPRAMAPPHPHSAPHQPPRPHPPHKPPPPHPHPPAHRPDEHHE